MRRQKRRIFKKHVKTEFRQKGQIVKKKVKIVRKREKKSRIR